MPRFTLPRDIYFGDNAMENLKNLKGKRAFVVIGGGSMRKLGFLDKLLGYLKDAGMETKLFEGMEADPSVDTVMKGAKAMSDFQPDWIVSIGGGSPIDAAKAMWVFYEHPQATFEQLCVPFTFPELRTKARFAAVPSTSGTGTEVTAFSIITDTRNNVKYPLADFNITPDIAILDPELAEAMPKDLTAHTGMDALTHAIEAYVSVVASPFTDPLALRAIEYVFKYLTKSYDGDKNAREQMHYGQCMAGMAFSNAVLGITHSMAHKTGAAFDAGHIPHGCANAIYMPFVIQYNAKKAKARYAEISRYLRLEGNTDDELVDALIAEIKKCNKHMGIPATLKEFGINEKEFRDKLSSIAEYAVGDACTGCNPRTITADQMEKLLTCTYYGSAVDF
ncbi:MAG: iron-containing alcohol dehydrogenase [Planctomycetaceae bacterium]|nr:iron-containing alcohol dehydrogenase [Planctomycetaceae bacterium]